MNKSEMHRLKGHRGGEWMEDVRFWPIPHGSENHRYVAS